MKFPGLFVKVCGRRMLLQAEHRMARSQKRVAISGEVSYDLALKIRKILL